MAKTSQVKEIISSRVFILLNDHNYSTLLYMHINFYFQFHCESVASFGHYTGTLKTLALRTSVPVMKCCSLIGSWQYYASQKVM